MKTKERGVRFKVRGARYQGINLHSEIQAGEFDRVGSELPENYVPSWNVCENKEHSPKLNDSRGSRGHSDSWLLTSDSCFSRNDGATGDVVENKGRVKTRCAALGVRERKERSSWSGIGFARGRRGHSDCWLLNSDSCFSRQDMKVQPEMLLKTKEGGKQGARCQEEKGSEVRGRESDTRTSDAPILAPDS